MLRIGSQYYRPPFPVSDYWEHDFAEMKAAGLNTVQLWVVWSWVEPEPGHYRFDDYDMLIDKASRAGLGVVLSTIAAVHPYWIHRTEPDSEMVTNFGQKVVSSNRAEIHFGITPGGCIDHPGVIKRMRAFLQATAERYKDSDTIVGWDAWNELRWNIHADGLVCYCEHTLREYRDWLDRKYGGLSGLNEAWRRRYGSWKDVVPGKMPNRPYTDMMAFTHFITERSNQHAQFRYETIKNVVGDKEVTVHGGMPTVLYARGEYPIQTPLARGNDWVLGETIDGIGCSSFPIGARGVIDPIDLHNRFEYLRSASTRAALWLSELQGGRYNSGFAVAPEVDAVQQQRWIWNGFAVGASTILLWCWRDEVFGREAGGFGFAGSDGCYPERATAMRTTRSIIDEHARKFDGYRPDGARVGVLFSPQSHYLMWAEEGDAGKCLDALEGYTYGLTRMGFDFDILEEEHLDRLDQYMLLILPRICVMDERIARSIDDWVRHGGRLIAESETGAFSPAGIYRYTDQRPLAEIGSVEIGRRPLREPIHISSSAGQFDVPGDTWLTPMVNSENQMVDSLEVPWGEGSILVIGSFPGNAYRALVREGSDSGPSVFETWISAEISATGLAPLMRPVGDGVGRFPCFAKIGSSSAGRLLFAFLSSEDRPEQVVFDRTRVAPGEWHDLFTGRSLTVREDGSCSISPTPWGVTVLFRGHGSDSGE